MLDQVAASGRESVSVSVLDDALAGQEWVSYAYVVRRSGATPAGE